VAYPWQAQGLIEMIDMYSNTGAGSPGAGLPAAKQVQVNQNTWYLNSSNQLAQGRGDMECVVRLYLRQRRQDRDDELPDDRQ
jgi:hypothetical protein